MGGTIIDTYGRVINYGVNKKMLRVDRLFLQGFMAGVFVGLAGHACSSAAGSFTAATDPGTTKIVYAIFFPVAFISIILTGAELFTGNTMTMIICFFHKKVTVLDLLVNWVLTLVSNFLGTLFAAYFMSYLTNQFEAGTLHEFITHNAEKKLSYGWGSTFLRGIGANTFVCLAVWQVIAVDDVAGKVLVLWFPVVAFCLAGFEHIVANFYTIPTGMMYGANISLFDCVFKNFAPTLLGNIVGGCVMVGAVYWYNCHETWSSQDQLTVTQLARESSVHLVRAGTAVGSRHSILPPLMQATTAGNFLSAKPADAKEGDSVRDFFFSGTMSSDTQHAETGGAGSINNSSVDSKRSVMTKAGEDQRERTPQ